MLKQVAFFILLLLFSLQLSAQLFSGKVVDDHLKQPLPFVNIIYNSAGQGTTTNIDGHFTIRKDKIEFLAFSYVGFEPLTIQKNEFPKNDVFILKEQKIELSEVEVYPGENPAHRIIKKMVKNRDQHDPQKWDSYQYDSYNKLVFSIFDDKKILESVPDTLTTKKDTTLQKFKNFINNQHLFLVETAARKTFKKPGKEKETVLASRVSGFEDPSFFTLATQLQSLTFYNDYVTLLEKDFLGPLSPNSWKKYTFILTDTLLTSNNDTVFTIQFEPRKNKYFMGLKGVMNVHTNGYAIQSVRAEDASKQNSAIAMKIEQSSELLPEGRWFPKELNSEIIYNNFRIAPTSGTSFMLKGSGKCYLSNRKTSPDIDKSRFRGANLQVAEDATNKDHLNWPDFRNAPLNSKDSCTYHVIDSLGKAEKLDKKMRTVMGLFENKLPVGKFNLRLNQVLAYNHFEGFQAGFGMETNDRFSKIFQFGAYWRYGFKDQHQKFGGDFSVLLNRTSETKIKLDYKRDRREIGEMFFLEQPRVFSSEEYRRLLYTDMFKIESTEFSFEHRWSKFLKTRIFYDKTNFFDPINVANPGLIEDKLRLKKIGIKMRISFGEQFFDNRKDIVSLGSKYPYLFINFENGIGRKGLTDYHSLEFKIRDSFRFRNLGTSHVTLLGAYRNETGYGNLFLSPPAAADHLVSIYAENSFATMPLNRFFANRMAAIFWRHDLGTLLYKNKSFKPRVSLAVNATWGKTNERYANYRDFGKGYYEGGILIRKLLKKNFMAIGVGGFYRFGTYHTSNFMDNLALKMTVDIAL